MTQAELDKAVLDAADNYEKGQSHLRMEVHIEPLLEAVRARRAAMRPTKLMLLSQFVRYRHVGETLRERWNALDEEGREEYRSLLAEILAAPDEEQP